MQTNTETFKYAGVNVISSTFERGFQWSKPVFPKWWNRSRNANHTSNNDGENIIINELREDPVVKSSLRRSNPFSRAGSGVLGDSGRRGRTAEGNTIANNDVKSTQAANVNMTGALSVHTHQKNTASLLAKFRLHTVR